MEERRFPRGARADRLPGEGLCFRRLAAAGKGGVNVKVAVDVTRPSQSE